MTKQRRVVECLHLALLSALYSSIPAQAGQDGLPPIEGLPFQIGTLDASATGATHPWLFRSPAEINRARERVVKNSGLDRAVFDRFLKKANEHLAIEIEPIDETWWETAKGKTWQETYPEVFENTWIKPGRYATPAAELATTWLLTDDRKYADKAVALLMNVAPFSFRMEHYDVGMNYSIWGLQALRAYDVLLPKLSAEQRREIDGFFTRLAWAVAKNDVYWIDNNIGGGINNHLAWHKTTLGLIGLFYDRDDMIDYCLNGRRGLTSLLEDGLLDDGLWCESSLNYQFAAIAPMLVFADCQRRIGHKPGLHKLVAANGRTLKQSYDAMFDVLAPDGLIPPIGDCYGRHAKLWEVPLYETCWRIWGDDKYAWLVNHNPEPTIASLFAPPLPKDAPAPPIGSMLLPEHGYAILRSHRDERYWDNPSARMAFLTYDRSGVHANADKLSLMLFSGDRMLLSDVEGRTTTQAHSFSSNIQGTLNRGGLSQNTVMIDGHNQRHPPRLLDLIEFRDLPDEKRATAADNDGILYDGVRQMRTVAMTPDYVLDVFQVDCGEKERQIDWIAHMLNEEATPLPETTTTLESSEEFALPETGPWRWLRDARSYDLGDTLQLGWKDDKARLRLRMLDPGNARVILCGYPATDEQAPPTIPMIIIRTRAQRATFAALWLIGDDAQPATLKQLPAHDGKPVYEVEANGKTRRHLVPKLGG